jgi:hypothetical protein
MTRAWAAEFSPSGVRVNAIAPGPVYTEGANSERTAALGTTTLLQRAAMEGWSRPEEFFPLFTALLKRDRLVAACLERTARSPDCPTRTRLGTADIAGLGDNKLLQCMMLSAPVCDEALEYLLTSARRTLLDLAGSSVAHDALRRRWAFAAPAQQCFINEYVFHCGDEEERLARALRDRLTAC